MLAKSTRALDIACMQLLRSPWLGSSATDNTNIASRREVAMSVLQEELCDDSAVQAFRITKPRFNSFDYFGKEDNENPPVACVENFVEVTVPSYCTSLTISNIP